MTQIGGSVKCEHVQEFPAQMHFVWDIDVRITGKRHTLMLCRDCYNRLLGAVAEDLVSAVVAKTVRQELRKAMR